MVRIDGNEVQSFIIFDDMSAGKKEITLVVTLDFLLLKQALFVILLISVCIFHLVVVVVILALALESSFSYYTQFFFIFDFH